VSDFGTLLTQIFALGTLVGNAILIGWLLAYACIPQFRNLFPFLNRYGLVIVFFIALFSSVGSLVYSNILGLSVCPLCWLQRICMYPIPFVAAYIFYTQNRTGLGIIRMLAFIGATVSFFHWGLQMLQMYAELDVPCSLVWLTPACSNVYVLEFGYITLPAMAMTAFLLILLATVKYAKI
jgi:disulfide bond formation protein DsbB